MSAPGRWGTRRDRRGRHGGQERTWHGRREEGGCSAGRGAAVDDRILSDLPEPSYDRGRLEAVLGAAILAEKTDGEAERRALEAFRVARDAGAHRARTRRRDDWRPRARRRGARSWKGERFRAPGESHPRRSRLRGDRRRGGGRGRGRGRNRSPRAVRRDTRAPAPRCRRTPPRTAPSSRPPRGPPRRCPRRRAPRPARAARATPPAVTPARPAARPPRDSASARAVAGTSPSRPA